MRIILSPAGWPHSKQEFGAYTLRPKIHRLLPDFLTDLPSLQSHRFSWPKPVPAIHWGEAQAGVAADPGVPAVSWCRPGEDAAREALRFFIQQRLPRYHLDRNDPNMAGQSDLSPYLHFGQIAGQRVAREVQQAEVPPEAKKAFLEELSSAGSCPITSASTIPIMTNLRASPSGPGRR